jgi:hypothetical protein
MTKKQKMIYIVNNGERFSSERQILRYFSSREKAVAWIDEVKKAQNLYLNDPAASQIWSFAGQYCIIEYPTDVERPLTQREIRGLSDPQMKSTKKVKND